VVPALDDFPCFCRVERRISPLTCAAYERDVRALLAFLEAESIAAVGDAGAPDLRRFLADEAASPRRDGHRGARVPPSLSTCAPEDRARRVAPSAVLVVRSTSHATERKSGCMFFRWL
jgi:site-specific recombinase XerC